MDQLSKPLSRLDRQIQFILEIDKAKQVLRRSRILDRSRRENDAEHSWHLAVMAMLLAEHARQPINVFRVVKMLLIHDIVEIDAGDAFLYDADARIEKKAKEEKAAQRIFGLLPDDQRDEFIALWQEFEACETPDAKFAAAIDRFQPLLANYHTQGGTWQEYGVTKDQVVTRTKSINEGSSTIWNYVCDLLDDAVAKRYFPVGPENGA